MTCIRLGFAPGALNQPNTPPTRPGGVVTGKFANITETFTRRRDLPDFRQTRKLLCERGATILESRVK